MKSVQALQSEILTLRRSLQAHYNQIAYLKSGANLLAAFFNPLVRRQSLQAVNNARRDVELTLVRMEDVQEQQLVALFQECWQEEFAHLSDSLLLDTTTIRRQCVYNHAQYRSLQQKRLQIPLIEPEYHNN